MDSSVNTVCVICGQAKGKPYECITAHQTVTGTKKRRKGSTTYSTSYSNVEWHSDCVCDACRKKQRLADIRRIGLYLIVSVAICIVLGLVINHENVIAHTSGTNSLGTLGSLAALAIIPCSIFAIASLFWFLGCLRGDYGSQALGAYYIRKHRELYPQDRGFIYMTPKKAKKEHLIN